MKLLFPLLQNLLHLEHTIKLGIVLLALPISIECLHIVPLEITVVDDWRGMVLVVRTIQTTARKC